MKKFFYILSITFGFCFTFFINHSSSYAISSSMALDYALWNAYNIGAEYACSRTARNLENPIYSDVVNISGINNPFSSSKQYGQILWNASGRTGSISQTDIWNALQQDIQDFDVSSMTSEELSDFLDRCGVILDDVGTNWAIKTSQLNGIRFYWATNKAGEWLGTSFQNILAKFDTFTPEQISNIQSSCDIAFPYRCFCTDYLEDVVIMSENITNTYTYNFSDTVFLYCPSSSPLYMHCVVPFQNGSCIINGTLKTDRYNKIYDEHTITTEYINFLKSGGTFIGTFDGYDFYDCTGIVGNTSYYSSASFSSLSAITDYLSQYGYVSDTINSELVDNQSVPYSVPDIGELATPITDIYPILESIREGIISIPIADELATILYPSLTDAIEDAIEDAKATSISIADTQDPSPPNPDDDEDEFQPIIAWVGDLLPDGMFTMFEPIFSIVPSNYSMYGFWISIPLIILVCILIYFIVSVL